MNIQDCQRAYDNRMPEEEREMSETHCRDCKHWKHHGRDAVWGDCLKITDSGFFEINIVNSYDAEESAELETHPDFGCVLGEVK